MSEEKSIPTEIRIELLEGKVSSIIESLEKMEEILRKKIANAYSEEQVQAVVEKILQNKVAVLIEGAVWMKVGNKYIAHNSLIFDERTGLPRSGEGATVFLALSDLAERYLFDEFGLPKPENT